MKKLIKEMLMDDLKCIKILKKRNAEIKAHRPQDILDDDGKAILEDRMLKVMESNHLIIKTTKERVIVLKHKLTQIHV